jgi:recombinational DNA repair protein RecT
MQPRTNGYGNGSAMRGQQGRPDIKATEKRGEALVRQLMEDRREEIVAMFARDEKPEASFTRAVGLAVSAYAKLQAENKQPRPIDEQSAVAAALWAFQRKLDPGTDVYFVPYKGKVTPIVSPQGLINVAFRSGMVLSVDARFVFKAEVDAGNFDHMLGSERWVKHRKGTNARPAAPQQAWKELAYAYAVVEVKGGGQPIIEVLDRADIEYYRSLSPAANNPDGLWGKFPAEAARKAALKQALARAPKQAEVSEILTADAANEESLAVPEELMKAAMARIQAEQDGNVPAVPPSTPSKPEEVDPSKLYIPGKPGTVPTVADASDGVLADWESKLRRALDAGEFDPGGKRHEHRGQYLPVLRAVRMVMRGRRLPHPDHPALGEGWAAPLENTGELTAEQEAELLPASDVGDERADFG